jgi:hypothetical protein
MINLPASTARVRRGLPLLLLLLVAPGSVAAAPRGAIATAADQDPSAHAVFLPLLLRDGAPRPLRADRATVFGAQLSEVRFRDPAMVSQVRRSGAVFLRSLIFWDEVEARRESPPRYDWSLYDGLLRHAHQEGLEIIAEVVGNPDWAAEYPGGPPRDLDPLVQFLAAAVERYDGDGLADAPGSPRIRYWELYNEPDNTDHELAKEGRAWGYWGREGAAYAQMLKRAYPAIRLANPAAKVLLGGLAYDAFPEDGGPFNPAFLDDVLRAGGGCCFDIMNLHYYPLFAFRWQPQGPDIVGKIQAVRRKLGGYGLDKPLMVTEAGMWSAALPPYPPATPDDQVRYVAKLFARSLATGVQTVIWFQYDDVTGFDDPARGLVDTALQPKPAETAFRLASELLADAVPERQSRDLLAAGEVYWFKQGPDRLAVAWTEDGSQASLSIRAREVQWVHGLGSRQSLRDESDGKLDGQVTVRYGRDPIFIQVPGE